MLAVISPSPTATMKNLSSNSLHWFVKKFAHAMIEVLPTSGLCSFYAEEGGLLMGYEI